MGARETLRAGVHRANTPRRGVDARAGARARAVVKMLTRARGMEIF